MRVAQVLPLYIAMAIVGCQRESGHVTVAKPAAPGKATVPVKNGPTLAELTAGMVEAASPGKSEAPLELKFDLQRRPTVGQPLEIEIALMPGISADSATIRLSGTDGLVLSAASEQIEISAIEASQVYRRIIRLTPTAEGVFVLGLTATLKHGEIEEYRLFSIPLIVAAK